MSKSPAMPRHASSGFGDNRRGMSGGRYVSLPIFITSMRGSKVLCFSLTASFTSGDHQA